MFLLGFPSQKERHPDQRYIFWLVESPELWRVKHVLPKLNQVFNLTMTYRLDSDFPFPVGYFVKTQDHPPIGPELERQIKEFGAKNSHLAKNRFGFDRGLSASWFSTRCNSSGHRELFVELIQKYMDVNIYGPCGTGNFNCPRQLGSSCYDQVSYH